MVGGGLVVEAEDVLVEVIDIRPRHDERGACKVFGNGVVLLYVKKVGEALLGLP